MSQDECAELVAQVVDICQTDEATARAYLQLFNWNLNDAVENILNAADNASASDDYSVHNEAVSGSSSIRDDEEPRPVHSSSSQQPKISSGPKIATLSSIDSRKVRRDSDDEEGQAFYVGGAEQGGGGQQVLGPPRLNNPESFVQGIFRAAREGGAETLDRTRASDLISNAANKQEAFVGTGYRLGESLSEPLVEVSGRQVASRTVGASTGHQHCDEEGQDEEHLIVVKLWNNGFSLDDGPLRQYTDPDSLEFMAAIKQGRIPSELISPSRGHEAHVLLEDHHNESYRQPPAPTVKAFSGVGRMLGNPTPAVISSSPSTAAAASSSTSLPPCPIVDQSKPTTQLQIRLSDGSRLIVRLNHNHTVQDLRAAIISQRPELASRSFGLQTTFPRTELKDNSATMTSANLLNSTLLVTMH